MTGSLDLVIRCADLTALQCFAVQIIITAVPGRDTARQNTLDGASIEVCEYFGVHAASLASAERRTAV